MRSFHLSANEKLAAYGAAAVLIGGFVGFWTGALSLLAMLASIGMLAVVFRSRKGNRGSIMLALGGVAGVVLVFGLLGRLGSIGLMLTAAPVPTIFYLVAICGGVVMAWAGWLEFSTPDTTGNVDNDEERTST